MGGVGSLVGDCAVDARDRAWAIAPLHNRLGVGLSRPHAVLDFGVTSPDLDGGALVGKCGDRGFLLGIYYSLGHDSQSHLGLGYGPHRP